MVMNICGLLSHGKALYIAFQVLLRLGITTTWLVKYVLTPFHNIRCYYNDT
jgi:hypothetical protein